MVNRFRRVLSTEDAASEVVETIRHSRKEGHSKAIPSVTKILKVRSIWNLDVIVIIIDV